MAIKISKYLVFFIFVMLFAAFANQLPEKKLLATESLDEIANAAKAQNSFLMGLSKMRVDTLVAQTLRSHSK